MRIEYTDQFRKQFRRIDKRIRKAFDRQIRVLDEKYPSCPRSLNVKKLKGSTFGQRSFRVTRDYRVVFLQIGDTLELLDILSHNDFDKKYG